MFEVDPDWPMHPAQQADSPFVSMERWQARARPSDDDANDVIEEDVGEAALSNVSSSSLENLFRIGTNASCCLWLCVAGPHSLKPLAGMAESAPTSGGSASRPELLLWLDRQNIRVCSPRVADCGMCARCLRLQTGSSGRACNAECIVAQRCCTTGTSDALR